MIGRSATPDGIGGEKGGMMYSDALTREGRQEGNLDRRDRKSCDGAESRLPAWDSYP